MSNALTETEQVRCEFGDAYIYRDANHGRGAQEDWRR